MEQICPQCGLPMPANEAAAYGRHENCHGFSANLPGSNHQPSKGKQPSRQRDAGGGRRVEKKEFRN